MWRVKSHFYTGSRIVREGTLLEQVEPRFEPYVEEVAQEKAENDYADGPPEDVEPPKKRILVHQSKGGPVPSRKKVK